MRTATADEGLQACKASVKEMLKRYEESIAEATRQVEAAQTTQDALKALLSLGNSMMQGPIGIQGPEPKTSDGIWTDEEALKVYQEAVEDDPWAPTRDDDVRKEIADEMRGIAAAKTIEDAKDVIKEWWLEEDRALEVVTKVRQAYKKTKEK